MRTKRQTIFSKENSQYETETISILEIIKINPSQIKIIMVSVIIATIMAMAIKKLDRFESHEKKQPQEKVFLENDQNTKE